MIIRHDRGLRHALDEPFFVLATDNDRMGVPTRCRTQIDRFLLKVLLPTPGVRVHAKSEAPTGSPCRRRPRMARRRAFAVHFVPAIEIAEPCCRYAARSSRSYLPPTRPDVVRARSATAPACAGQS